MLFGYSIFIPVKITSIKEARCQWQFLFFGLDEHRHWILHIRINLGNKFHFKRTILNFGIQFAKKTVFLVENGKSEHRHRILHIWIGCGNKFHFKQFLILGLNFPKNSISGRKLKKWTSPWYTVVCLTIWHTYYSNSDWSTLDFLLTDVTKVL